MENDNSFENEYGSEKRAEFEDISSNSEKFQVDTRKIDLEFGDNAKHYRRKKRGIVKFFDDFNFRIYKWWKCMKKTKKAILITFTSLIALVLAVCIVIMSGGLNRLYNYKDEKFEIKGEIDENVMNIALFGIDSRDTKGKNTFSGNSDSIMILSLNSKTKKIKIISLLRDTFVPIERDGKTTYGKINSAYARGGPKLAVETINRIFDLDITEYATVNFYGMADIIDAVGGLDVELTQNEVTARGENNHGINDMIQEICYTEGKNANDYYVKKWGKQHLNGLQAVAYSRIRYCRNIWGTSNDYGRSDRQRFVMRQLFNAVKNIDKSGYVSLARALVPCTETSLEFDKIVNIGWGMMTNKPEFEEYRIPLTEADADREKGEKGSDYDFLMTPTPSGYGSVIYIDLDYAAKVIHAILYEEMTAKEYIAANPIEKNRWYKGSYNSGSSGAGSTTSTPTESTEKPKDTAPPDTDTPDDDTPKPDDTGNQGEEPKDDGNNSQPQDGGEDPPPVEGGEVE